MMTKPTTKIQAVDLFCGIGGLTYGLREAGIDVRAGVDNDGSCRGGYVRNNKGAKFIDMDIRDVTGGKIREYYEGADVRVLVGCAPCQPFSAHARKNKARGSHDDCSLLLEFSRLIKESQPDIVSVENVPGLARHGVFEEFMQNLRGMGYACSKPRIVFCPEYGVPQTRRRLVLLASKRGDIDLVPPTCKSKAEWPTVGTSIKGLPPIQHGGECDAVPDHCAMKLNAKNLERIRQSKPGGSWRDWDEDIVADCHRKSYYPAPYGRMEWGSQAPTITTQFCYYSTGRFGHPSQDRAISLREAACLQTFPESYTFQDEEKTLTAREIARQIGNAVPVELARAIGNSIRGHVDGH